MLFPFCCTVCFLYDSIQRAHSCISCMICIKLKHSYHKPINIQWRTMPSSSKLLRVLFVYLHEYNYNCYHHVSLLNHLSYLDFCLQINQPKPTLLWNHETVKSWNCEITHFIRQCHTLPGISGAFDFQTFLNFFFWLEHEAWMSNYPSKTVCFKVCVEFNLWIEVAMCIKLSNTCSIIGSPSSVKPSWLATCGGLVKVCAAGTDCVLFMQN